MEEISEILLTIDNNVLEKYKTYYFKLYPKRRKFPIDKPTHPSINKWMILPRIQMNAMKQQYKDFIIWFVEDQGLTNKNINKCSMTFVSYFKTKIRTDIDNYSPKFYMDGFVESGLIIDDDYLHIESLTMKCGYSKEHPRTEILIEY